MIKRASWICFSLLLALVPAQAETVIKDDFATTGQRSVGEKLHKTATESRNASWDATGNIMLAEDQGKGCVNLSDSMGFVAKVKVPTGSKVIRVEADVHPQPKDAGEQGGFISIGIGKPPQFNVTWLAGVYVSLTSTGRSSIGIHPDFGDGTDPNKSGSTALKGLLVKSYKPDGMNKVVIEYDVETNSVTASVNGEEIASHYALEKNNFTPTVEYAGFSGWALMANEPLVTNFSVTVK